MGRQKNLHNLTERERDVLELVRLGLTNAEIAERLGISEQGVKYHVSQILSKLGLSSRDEAAEWRPEEPRRWAFGLPALAWKAPAAAVVVAAVAGLGVLAWGVQRNDARYEEKRDTSSAVTNTDGPVPFRVCSRNDTWVRPTEEEMSVTAWQDPRHSQLPLATRRDMLERHVIRYVGSASLSGPQIVLSGLGEYPFVNTRECGDERERHLAASRSAIEIWLLAHEPTAVERVGMGYRVYVTPLPSGYRAIQFGSAETYHAPVQVVNANGAELWCSGPPDREGECL